MANDGTRYLVGALGLALGVGCAPIGAPVPPAGSAPPSPPVASVMPSAEPMASPVVPASAAASASPAAPSASPRPVCGTYTLPTPSGPQPAINNPRLGGNVYDEAGRGLEGVRIEVVSLDAAVPYRSLPVLTCPDGSWLIPRVPEGANVEIVASKPGWTTRRRVGAFQYERRSIIVDFGAPAGAKDADPISASNFLTDRPEIVAVEPAPAATNVDPAFPSLVLRLSEPLDAASRAALADGIVIWPANEAAGAPAGLDLSTPRQDLGAAYLDFAAASPSPEIGYAIRTGPSAGRELPYARATWEDAGTKLTVTLNVALRTGRSAAGRYQIGLVAGQEPIRDAAGNQLGTDWTGDLQAYPPPGRLIAGAFHHPPVAGAAPQPSAGAAAMRWAATHAAIASFDVRPDALAPTLVNVRAGDLGEDARLELRFSEPMAVFDGTPGGWTDPRLRGAAEGDGAPDDPGFMQRFSFALASQPEGLEVLRLDGRAGDEPIFDPTTGGEAPRDVEFALRPAALRLDGDLAAAAPGQVVIGVMPEDPRVVTLTFKARAGLFDGAGGVAVRVADVADPAGNVITHADADRQVVKAALRAAGEGR